LHSAGLRSVQYYLFRLGVDLRDPKVYGITALMIATCVAFFNRKRKLSTEQFFAMLFLLYLIVELFTPALRFGYYVVQWAAVSLMVLANYKQHKVAAGLMLLGLLINHGYIPFPDVYEGMAGESLMVMALIWFVFLNGNTKIIVDKLNKVENVQVSDTTKAQ